MKYKIATWNLNGIRACARKGLLDWVHHSGRQVLCFQETRVHPEQILPLYPELVDSKKFHIEYTSPLKKGYSGVAIFSHKKLPRPSFEKGLGKKEFDDEGRTLIVQYPQFILINGYFPNGQRDHGRVPYKLAYGNAVLRKASDLKKKLKRPVIICGDLNTAHKEIDLANPKQNENTTGFLPIERAWMDKALQKGFSDVYREKNGDKRGEYTWWTYRNRCRERNIGWRIDYFLSSKSLLDKITKCSHRPEILGSDHCPVYCDLEF